MEDEGDGVDTFSETSLQASKNSSLDTFDVGTVGASEVAERLTLVLDSGDGVDSVVDVDERRKLSMCSEEVCERLYNLSF